MHFISNPYVTDFEVVGSNNEQIYELITSYKGLRHQSRRVLFEFRQQLYYKIINFLKDFENIITAIDFDIFGTYLRISTSSCLCKIHHSYLLFIYYIPFVLL